MLAALTVLTAGDIAPSAVDGLEVWQYKAEWIRLSRQETDAIIARYSDLKTYLQNVISG